MGDAEGFVTFGPNKASLLLSELSQLSESFHDVRLVSSGGELGVQALLLAAASPFLATLLADQAPGDDEIGSLVLLLPDFSLDEVHRFVRSLLTVQSVERKLDDGWALFRLLMPAACSQEMEDADDTGQHTMNMSPECRRYMGTEIDDACDNDRVNHDTDDERSNNEEHNSVDEDDDNVDDPSTDGRSSTTAEGKRPVSRDEVEVLVARYTLYEEASREFCCGKCGKLRTKCRNTLRAHILSDLDLFLFKCTVCDKMFRQKGYLNRHMRKHSDGGGRMSRGGESLFKDESMRPDAADDEHGAALKNKSYVSRREELSQSEIYSRETEVMAEDITKEGISSLNNTYLII